MKELNVITIGRKQKNNGLQNGLQFVNQKINKLPGTFLVAGGVGFFEYAHEELEGVIGVIDFKVIMCITIFCFLLGVKSCIHSIKETMELKQEVARLRSENRKLRSR